MSHVRVTFGIIWVTFSLLTGSAAGQTAPTTQPTQLPQLTDLKLSIIEVVGLTEELEVNTAADLARQVTKPRRSPGAEFDTQVDLAAPAKLIFNSRSPKRGKWNGHDNITYVEVGTKLVVSGTWEGDQAEVRLKIDAACFGVPGVTTQPADAVNEVKLDRVLMATNGKPIYFKFEDQPVPVGNPAAGQARLHVGTLTVKRLVAQDGGTSPSPGTVVAPHQRTLLEMEEFAVDADRDQMDKVELGAVLAGAPGGAQILQRLGELGEAHRSFQYLAAVDLAMPQQVTAGGRVPSVQDVFVSPSGRVTPSITYEEIGSRLVTAASRWERVGDQWVCDVGLKLQASGVGDSGLRTGAEDIVSLPAFMTVSTDARRRFQSGRPEYFLFRGDAGQGAKGKVPVWVARVVLTRAE